MSENTQVAVTRKGVAGMILSEAGRARLAGLVPKGDTLERVASVAALEVRKNPALAECEPMSILESVGRIMAWGLEIGETAYLVPFGKKCQPMKGYQGLIQLMYDSGYVRSVEPSVVYEGDKFRIEKGLEPILEHQPVYAAKERGKILGAYCIVRLRGDRPGERVNVFEFFPAETIDAVRQKYSKQWKNGPLPAWYALKYAITHVAKMLPKSSKFAAIHEVVRREETEAVEDAEIIDTATGEVFDAPAPEMPRTPARLAASSRGAYGDDLTARPAIDSTFDPYEEDDAA